MPVTCTQCGNELPREDARFCSNCGTPVVPPPARAVPGSLRVNTPPKTPQSSFQGFPQESRHGLREQIAHQPRPARLTRDISHDNNGQASSQQALERERPDLRVRVWNQESQPSPQSLAIDELPTQETPASPAFMPSPIPEHAPFPSERSVSATPPPVSRQSIQSHVEQPNQEQERREQIAQQSTSRMPSVTSSPNVPSEPRPTPFLGIQDIESLKSSRTNGKTPFPIVPPTPDIYNVPPTPASPLQQTSMPPVEPVQQFKPIATGPASPAPQLTRQQVRRGPGPLVLLGVVVLALIIAGAAWVAIVQPFNVPSVTRPLQDYRDTHLGVALSYPSDWVATHSTSSVLFSDSSQTAQITIAVLPMDNAPGGDIGTYLQKQAAKLTMTGAKTITQVTFAGAKWQQIQGNVQNSGVNDTETLFATTHNNQLYVLTQSAPQSVYADEESLIFSKMRTSLQLL